MKFLRCPKCWIPTTPASLQNLTSTVFSLFPWGPCQLHLTLTASTSLLNCELLRSRSWIKLNFISSQSPSPNRFADVRCNSVATGFVRFHFVALIHILFLESLGFSLLSPVLLPEKQKTKLVSSVNFFWDLSLRL